MITEGRVKFALAVLLAVALLAFSYNQVAQAHAAGYLPLPPAFVFDVENGRFCRADGRCNPSIEAPVVRPSAKSDSTP